MDQRPDKLDGPGWIEDRRTTLPTLEGGAMAAETVEYHDSEAERIKADIEDTRAEMGQTINEIQERLSPEHLMDQVKETVREATIGKVERAMNKVGEKISDVAEPAMDAMGRAGGALRQTGSSVANTVRENPIPCALIGLGLGMFIVRRVRNADSRTSRSIRYQSDLGYESGTGYGTGTTTGYAGMARQYGSTSGEYAGASRQYGASGRGTFTQVRQSANELAHGTVEKVSQFGHQAKEGALWAGRGLQHLVQENPLAVGAAAVAVGAAVGLMLPRTQIEHEYMGEASEKIVDKAQQVAREAMDKVKTATQGDAGAQPQQPQGAQSQQPPKSAGMQAQQAPGMQPQQPPIKS